MKVNAAALLGAGLVTCSVYAGAGAGLSNRARYPRQIGAFNTTSHESVSTPSLSTTSTVLPLSTTTTSESGPSNYPLASPDLQSQQDPSSFSTATDSWASDSTTLKTRTRGRSKAQASSPLPSLPPSLNGTLPLATGRNSSTSDGPSSTTRRGKLSGKVSSGKYGATKNSTNSLNPPKTRTKHSSRPTHASNGTITGTKTRPHATSRRPPKARTTVTMDCPVDGQKCYIIGGERSANETLSISTITRPCTPFYNDDQPMIIYSIVHTKTVTFYGNRSDYTPPFSAIKTPEYCSPSPTRLLLSSTEGFLPHVTEVTIDTNGFPDSTVIEMLTTHFPLARPKITFITTDKNPSVVFPSDPPPDYSATWSDPYPSPIVHKSVPAAGKPTPDEDNQPRPTFSITAKGDQVIINSRTYSSLRPDQTTVVTVDGGKFTISPTAIVGEGGSVAKPPPARTDFGVQSPTKGSVGGLGVTLSGSQAVIGGVTMTLPPYGTTTMINGESVTIGANNIIVGTNSFAFNPSQAPAESDVVVAGGEMLTAVGQSVVVIHSKTITYGPGMSTTTEVIEGDTITIGPSGVMVHGMMIGGSKANATDTKYEIIGGATITKIAPSIAIINGKTFTIGPGTHLTTTMIAGQEFTIGPMGVIVSTLTLPYPFGTSVITTIAPTGTWLNTFPIETSANKDDDSMGTSLRPSLSSGGMALCIAIGVLIFA